MTKFTFALHDTNKEQNSENHANLKYVFSGVDAVVLFGKRESNNDTFAHYDLLMNHEKEPSIAFATNLKHTSLFSIADVNSQATFDLMQLFSDEKYTSVQSWFKACHCTKISALVDWDSDIGIIAWNAKRPQTIECPGGYAMFVSAYVSCLLSALKKINPQINWRFAGNLHFISIEEGKSAQRNALTFGITLFNVGTSGSSWVPPLLIQTKGIPKSPSLCFGSPVGKADMAGHLISESFPPTSRWPWHQIPVYVTLNFSVLHQLAMWIIFIGFSVLFSVIISTFAMQ